MSQVSLPENDAAVLSTVRILAGKKNEKPSSVGTGFFYRVDNGDIACSKVVIMTNKHVVEGYDYINFTITSSNNLNDMDKGMQPADRSDLTHHVDLICSLAPEVNNYFPHPDAGIDLCAIEISNIFMSRIHGSSKVRAHVLDSSYLMTEPEAATVAHVEQIMVCGYPTGLWDSINNMPISRVGHTATNMLTNFNGKREFLVDMPIFGGSSGSPVFRYEMPAYKTSTTNLSFGARIKLAGIIWGTLNKTQHGEIKVIEIPTFEKAMAEYQTNLSLGIAHPASTIKELAAIIGNRINEISSNIQT